MEHKYEDPGYLLSEPWWGKCIADKGDGTCCLLPESAEVHS